jgi:hypothetical protein
VSRRIRANLEEIRDRADARRAKRGSGARYEVLHGKKWIPAPGVTTVLGWLDKSRPLMIWASRLEREAAGLIGWDLHQDEMYLPTKEAYLDAFAGRQKEKLAWVKELKKACEIGTDLHALVEHDTKERLGIDSTLPDVRDEAEWIFPQWEEWADVANYEPIATEFIVYGKAKIGRETRAYAGTADVLAWAEDKLVLGDWKTSNAFHGEMAVQNSAYIDAARQMGVFDGVDVPVEGLIVRVPKLATDAEPFERWWIDMKEHDERLTAFRHLRFIHDWAKREDDRGKAEWRAKKKKERG